MYLGACATRLIKDTTNTSKYIVQLRTDSMQLSCGTASNQASILCSGSYKQAKDRQVSMPPTGQWCCAANHGAVRHSDNITQS